MKLEFTRHIFSTLTYSRDYTLLLAWKTISKDYNRYLQRFSRLHNCKVEYLRVIEEHEDKFPHIHALLQFPDARISIENHRYFDREIYSKWKTLWTRGHSDYQKPRSGPSGTIPYLMKYLLKNQTSRTIWKKIMPKSISQEEQPVSTSYDSQNSTSHKKDSECSELNSLDSPKYPTHLNGVKLASWSRGFDWSLVKRQSPKIGKQTKLI